MSDTVKVKYKDGRQETFENCSIESDGKNLKIDQASGKAVLPMADVEKIDVKKNGSPAPKLESLNEKTV